MVDLLKVESSLHSFIDGNSFKGKNQYKVEDRYDGKIIHQVSSISIEDVPKIVELAQKAHLEWKKTSIITRRNILNKAASLLRERASIYSEIENLETSNSAPWCGLDVGWGADTFEESASCATSALKGTIQAGSDQAKTFYHTREPYGVVLSMAPWNAPLALASRAIASPLMGGNSVIFKTSEFSPRTQMIMAQVLHEAGLPAGVLNMVHISPTDAPAIVEAFIASKPIRKVNFTGSTRVGRIIAASAGKHLKPVVLELGGMAPLIICADANLEIAANVAVFSALFNSGQVCMSLQTLLVDEKIAPKVLELIKSQMNGVKAQKDGMSVQGLFNSTSANRVKEIVEDALAKGAEVAAGTFGVEGSLVQPLLLTGVTNAMRIYEEELFAPVFSMITFKTEEEAIQIANDHPYGLSSSIYSSNIENAMKMSKEIDAGMVHINGSTVFDSAITMHGGVGDSGFGRFNGTEGIHEFTYVKLTGVHSLHPFPI